MFATPEEAEAAFYDAFTRGDVQAMQTVWLDDDSIVCIHPGADVLEGRKAVHASWRQILQQPPGLRHAVRSRNQGPSLAVHVGHEWISVGRDDTAALAVTNVYQVSSQGWQMLLHHAASLNRRAAGPGRTPVH